MRKWREIFVSQGTEREYCGNKAAINGKPFAERVGCTHRSRNPNLHRVAGVCARAIELHAAYPTLYTRTRSTAREKELLQHGSESETPRWFHTPLFSTVPVVECTGIEVYIYLPVLWNRDLFFNPKTTAGETRSSLSPSQAHTSALASHLLISH